MSLQRAYPHSNTVLTTFTERSVPRPFREQSNVLHTNTASPSATNDTRRWRYCWKDGVLISKISVNSLHVQQYVSPCNHRKLRNHILNRIFLIIHKKTSCMKLHTFTTWDAHVPHPCPAEGCIMHWSNALFIQLITAQKSALQGAPKKVTP